ncbi:MAG: hypothetical protein HS126_00020 [Anaerolineales bacterium]|nr:hypothetical protein [Anaerolineales bacterium]
MGDRTFTSSESSTPKPVRRLGRWWPTTAAKGLIEVSLEDFAPWHWANLIELQEAVRTASLPAAPRCCLQRAKTGWLARLLNHQQCAIRFSNGPCWGVLDDLYEETFLIAVLPTGPGARASGSGQMNPGASLGSSGS